MTIGNVITELIAWRTEFLDAIKLSELGESRECLGETSNRYGALKKKAIGRCKELQVRDSKGELNCVEKYLLVPAIKEIVLHCNARLGSMDRQELNATLCECEEYLADHLTEMQEGIKITAWQHHENKIRYFPS